MFRRRQPKFRRAYTLIEVTVAVFLMTMGVLAFAALYPSAAYSSRMSGNHTQAISEVQHKIDQLRAVGYGRLTYAELRDAGIIDANPATQPWRYDGVDQLSTLLPQPVGTISVADAGSNLRRITVTLRWTGAPKKAMEGSHDVTILIANQ